MEHLERDISKSSIFDMSLTLYIILCLQKSYYTFYNATTVLLYKRIILQQSSLQECCGRQPDVHQLYRIQVPMERQQKGQLKESLCKCLTTLIYLLRQKMKTVQREGFYLKLKWKEERLFRLPE